MLSSSRARCRCRQLLRPYPRCRRCRHGGSPCPPMFSDDSIAIVVIVGAKHLPSGIRLASSMYLVVSINPASIDRYKCFAPTPWASVWASLAGPLVGDPRSPMSSMSPSNVGATGGSPAMRRIDRHRPHCATLAALMHPRVYPRGVPLHIDHHRLFAGARAASILGLPRYRV